MLAKGATTLGEATRMISAKVSELVPSLEGIAGDSHQIQAQVSRAVATAELGKHAGDATFQAMVQSIDRSSASDRVCARQAWSGSSSNPGPRAFWTLIAAFMLTPERPHACFPWNIP
jgi:hypothetical protein